MTAFANRRPQYCFLLLTLLWAKPSFGDDGCGADDEYCIEVNSFDLSVSLGLGQRSNPLVDSKSIPLLVVPQFSYYGKRFFIDNLDLGYTLYESPGLSAHLIATPGYDRVFFTRDDPQNYVITSGFASSFNVSGSTGDPVANPPSDPPPDPPPPPPQNGPPSEELLRRATDSLQDRERKATYLAGFEFDISLGQWLAQVDLLREVTGRHDGEEFRLAIARPWQVEQWGLNFSVGATWKSSELVTYYYADSDFFELGAATNVFVKAGGIYPISRNWDFQVLAHWEWLGDSIRQSPIIDDKRIDTLYFGWRYHF